MSPTTALGSLARRLGITEQDLIEAIRQRDDQLAHYQAGLAASRLNRDRWPATLRSEVEKAERGMRGAT